MTEFLTTTAEVLGRIAPFLLLGFVVAGLLHAFVPGRWLQRAVGGTGAGPIVRAALVGIPLPLCSCGVIPVAVELRKRGAGRGASTSFLVSTPETGVDSIATSAAVLHPLMVVFRPLAALVTAVATGFAVERWTTGPEVAAPEHGDDHHCCHSAEDELSTVPRGFVGGMRYAFVDLFGEVAVYLVPAVLITAVLTAFLEPDFVSGIVSSHWLQMLILLVAGIPVYVCAAAATPVAAALIVAGFSPGAALVFLLAGPATNLVTISAAASMLGKAGAVVYVVTVAAVSLGFGVLLDVLYESFSIAPKESAGQFHEHTGWLNWVAAGIVALLVAWHIGRRLRKGATQ